MNYLKTLKNCTLVFLLFNIISCSNQVTIPEDSYVIKNISIIDPIDGLQSNKHVVITNDIITMILDNDDELIAKDDNTIDATGKYLIPGLWDAHIHFSFDTNLAPYMPGLFLAHGVTSVRDTGGPIDLVVKMKDLSLNDSIKNPNVYIAGPLIDGTPNVYNNSSPSFPLLSIENNDIIEIESNVLGIVDREVDFLKAYEMLTENQFLALMRIAKKRNLSVTGHIPLSMTLSSAVNAGLNGMEHIRNLELSVASNSEELYKERLELLKNPNNLPGSVLRSSIHSKQRLRAIDSFDNNKFQEVIKEIDTSKDDFLIYHGGLQTTALYSSNDINLEDINYFDIGRGTEGFHIPIFKNKNLHIACTKYIGSDEGKDCLDSNLEFLDSFEGERIKLVGVHIRDHQLIPYIQAFQISGWNIINIDFLNEVAIIEYAK